MSACCAYFAAILESGNMRLNLSELPSTDAKDDLHQRHARLVIFLHEPTAVPGCSFLSMLIAKGASMQPSWAQCKFGQTYPAQL